MTVHFQSLDDSFKKCDVNFGKEEKRSIKVLPPDFSFSKYGIEVRFVNEDDAKFILDLRTHPKLSKYIHKTSPDMEFQIQWIRNYKKREKEGVEYYFLFKKNNESVGVIRITDIHNDKASLGSWLCIPDTEPEVSVATLIIARDILFETLSVERDIFNVDRGNKHVARLHKQMGAYEVNENERGFQYVLERREYLKNRDIICNILNLI